MQSSQARFHQDLAIDLIRCGAESSFRFMEALSKIAHRRLDPPLSDPGYLALRSRRLIFSTWARQFQGQRLTVLDIGGRYQPYRPLFDGCAERYYGVDLVKTEFVKVVADAEALPFAPGTFDLIIATQVFEYFRNPAQAAQQMHSALKPGGVLLASFAACTPRFAEEEYWRFTPAGFRLMLAPFATVETIPEISSVGGLIRTLNQGMDTFVRYRIARRVYRWTMGPLLNLLGLGFEKLKLTSNDQFTTNFSVKAVKEK
jgi:SAM-dependent methyltransferase